MKHKIQAIALLLLAGATTAGLVRTFGNENESAIDQAALERTRREVKMLDDLYKPSIVFINDEYVEDVSDVAAGEIAREIFGAMKQKGWHDARLIDGTGKPKNSKPKIEPQ